jgi:hypothetical protein
LDLAVLRGDLGPGRWQRAEEGCGFAVAGENDDVAAGVVEEFEYSRSDAAAEREDPVDELAADVVVDA